MRNPIWTREELILALDLYLRLGRRAFDASHPSVIELSRFLVARRGEEAARYDPTFRNPNGVAMKLHNISAVDPGHSGSGLPRGNRLEHGIWTEFGEHHSLLRTAVDLIRTGNQVP
jgi:5-methylcytosine-specific restriction enzyme A